MSQQSNNQSLKGLFSKSDLELLKKYNITINSKSICFTESLFRMIKSRDTHTIKVSYKLEDIYKLTIRKFSKMLQRIDHKLHYQIYLSAEMSGMVEFKNKDAIVHWMNDLSNKDEYQDVKVDMEDMNSKIDVINR